MHAGNITFDDCIPEGNNDVCCVSEGSRSCVRLPEDLSNLVVIWPRTPNSEFDCACLVFYYSPLLPDVTFESCYCIKQHLTSYNVTLNQVDKQLCWNNLTRSANDTKVIICRDDYLTRTFQSETLITVEGIYTYDNNRYNYIQLICT